MATCPKCFKQNPGDAAFCGFCGAQITPPEASAGGAKTMFGYNYGTSEPQAPTPGPAPEPARAPEPAPTPDAAAPGQGLVAGKYRLGELEKRLPAGELYLASDANQQGELEILLVDKAVFQSPLDMERARRELRQLQKVECTAILRVLDHGKAEDDRLFVVMEQARGVALDEVVSRSPMDLGEAQRVVKGVGTGLAEAQKMGVIHRDIAPHNILVCDDGTIKVRGFGVAAPIKRHVSGTPGFISPEQASGRPVDQRSNIYSLGVLMFYMLTGEPPFVSDNIDEILEKHQKEDPGSPRQRRPELELPARAEALIAKALAKSSSRRHLTLRQFLREVDSVAVSTGPHDQVEDLALSFETPLHGVTALKGGQEPPPSSEPKLQAIQAADLTAPTADVPASAPTLIEVSAPRTAPPVERSAPAQPAPIQWQPEPAAPQPAAQPAPAPAPVQPVQPAPPADQPASRMSQITGEVSSNVKLKQPEPGAAAPPMPEKPAQAQAAQAAQAPQAPAGPPGKAGFRETMWFYKGEVESAMVEEGSEEMPKPPDDDTASPEELASKYADDGSLSDEAARRLSLRTGKTQMMQNANIPKGQLPGERMGDNELIGEISRVPPIAIYIGIGVLLAAVGGVVAWLMLH